MIIRPARRLAGRIILPGDKSISHRAAMLAALAEGETRIRDFAASADCTSTLNCLHDLGVEIDHSGSTVVVKGVGKTGFRGPELPLDCGNSGTTMRLLAGVLAGQDFESVLTGDDSLQKRPMRRIIEPLEKMGCRVDSCNGRAPLTISGKHPLGSFDHELAVASAQIKSCILLAGLNAGGRTSVLEPTPTRDHTERMLRWFGVDVREEVVPKGKRISVDGRARLKPQPISVPSDISSAAFFIVAAGCLGGSELSIKNVGLNPTRTAVLDVLSRLGASIEIADRREINNEPAGRIKVSGGVGRAKEGAGRIGGDVIANLIDEIPILAVFGTQVPGGLEVRDAAELRVKESDRISSVVQNLREMGAAVEEYSDGFRVDQSELKGARIDSFGDHRIAMAFAVAGLLAKGETEIAGAECAAVSFPQFYETLAEVTRY